jgi:hypothetical protein
VCVTLTIYGDRPTLDHGSVVDGLAVVGATVLIPPSLDLVGRVDWIEVVNSGYVPTSVPLRGDGRGTFHPIDQVHLISLCDPRQV